MPEIAPSRTSIREDRVIAAGVQETVSQRYGGLSGKLRVAADFVVANPGDVATRSLRAVARMSGVSPATYCRLAHALGYRSYEELREHHRADLGRRVTSFSERARILRHSPKGKSSAPFLDRQTSACMGNLSAQLREMDYSRLAEIVARLSNARRVLLVGALSSAAIVDYFAYLASWFADGWSVAGRNGVVLPAALSGMRKDDVVVVLSQAPFARRSIAAARLAAEAGVAVVVITDSHTCPAARHATYTLIVPSDSPQFFSSYVATMVLVETIIGMLVAGAGPEAESRIAEIEKRNRQLDDF